MCAFYISREKYGMHTLLLINSFFINIIITPKFEYYENPPS